MTRLLGGASAFLLIISAYGWQRERQRGPATRPWDTYEVILWQAGQPVPSVKPALRAQRLREMGFTAEQAPWYAGTSERSKLRMRFYVENVVSELAFHPPREEYYQADWKNYTATRDSRFLTRKPCLDDPAFWTSMEARVAEATLRHAENKPLFYDLRDEPSLGKFTSPMDYCFCPHTMRALREWLRTRYGTLEALNQEWGTSFGAWEDVAPQTTYEAKAAEKTALSSGRPVNYAAWADHREFMDVSFAAAIGRLRKMFREADPKTPVGIAGTTMPAAWGGYDLWRLSGVIDCVEAYDHGNSREIFRSFLKPETPVLATVFQSDFARIRRELWWRLLQGDRGVVVWDDKDSRLTLPAGPDVAPTDRGKGLAPVLAEISAAAPKVIGLQPENDRIAIHYSQASIRAHWMFDSREDADSWPRRLASYEQANSRLGRLRASFVHLTADLGYSPRFVAYEQIENDELARGGYRVLLLPQSVAMSAKECARIRAFVEAGGTVIADTLVAMMDEHGKWLPRGQLDDLFGIQYKSGQWRPAGVGGEFARKAASDPLIAFDRDLMVNGVEFERTASGAPVVLTRSVGKGRAVYLNLDLHGYWSSRLKPGGGDNYLQVMSRILASAGIRPAISVADAAGAPLHGARVFRYSGKGRAYAAVMRSPEFELEALGRKELSNAAFEKPARVRIALGAPIRAVDLRTGRDFGVTDAVETDLDPWSPILLELGAPSNPSKK